MNKKLVLILFGICLLNACDSDTKQTGYENCSDVGCFCNTDTFRNICDGTTRIACDGGIVTEHNCADDGFLCSHGKCYVKPDTTCPADFKDKCIGNVLYYCSENHHVIYRDECDGDGDDSVCATINQVTDCYDKCDSEGEVYYSCSYSSNDEPSFKYTCSKTDKGLLWVPSEETCYECYTVNPGGDIVENGRYNNVCAKDECAAGAEDAACSGNQAVNCIDGYELKFDCGDLQCVVEEELGAICAETCSPEQADTTKHVCVFDTKSYYDFESTSYTCEKIGDKYYWIYDDTDYCRHGCNDTTNECLKIHPDEDKPCSMYEEDANYYPERCENNIILSCEGRSVMARDCEGMTCLNIDDYGYNCYELCTAEEIANPRNTCAYDGPAPTDSDVVMADSYYTGCEEIEGGKYIKRNSYNHCSRGCNLKTGECEKAHPDEGKPCGPNQQEYCSDDVLLYCDMGTLRAVSCEDELDDSNATCIQLADSIDLPYGVSRTRCALSCSESDIGQPVKVCKGDYLYTLECMSDGNGHYYFEDEYYSEHPQEYTYCDNGCDSTKNECIKLHELEGEICDPNASDSSKCATDEIFLNCTYSETDGSGNDIYRYKAYDCTSVIQDFENASCVEVNTAEYKLNPYCRATCTAADIGHPRVSCGGNYLEGWECIEAGGIYYWSRIDEYCTHGCDTSNDTCIKLHEREGELCNPKEVYSTCIDDYVMFCEEAEFNNDTNQMNYRYVLEQTCNPDPSSSEYQPIPEGMPEFERYACVTYTEMDEDYYGNIFELQHASCLPECKAQDVEHPVITCEDDHSDSWTCVQSGDTYYWDYDAIDCDNGCDPNGPGCLLFSDLEGTDCNYPSDSHKCDGKAILICENDDKWHILDMCEAPSVCTEFAANSFSCSALCLPEEAGTKRDICDDDEYMVLNNYVCLYDENLDDYRWQNDTSYTCNHGCNSTTNECITIHDDEYMECSSDETDSSYYPTQCDNNIYLACEGYDFINDTSLVMATDCSLDGLSTCHPQLGCYIPCDAASDEMKNYCLTREQDNTAYIKTGKCVLDNDTQINYVDLISYYGECLNGCNAAHDGCQD